MRIQPLAASRPEFLQRFGVLIIISALPFVESELGSTIGVVSDLNPVVVVGAAVVGKIISTVLWGLLFSPLPTLGISVLR